jgi:hypothetical protein
VPPAPDPPRRFVAIYYRHHDVHQDQVGLEAVEQDQTLQAVRRRGHDEARVLQQVRESPHHHGTPPVIHAT